MRATVYHGPRDIRVDQVPDATLREPTDALLRVTHACVCGSDLWPYRGGMEIYGPAGGRTGHEFMGVVEAVGAAVQKIRPGDHVIAPFAYSDGTCDFCAEDLHTSCLHGGYWGGQNDGGQGEAVRVPMADGTLVVLPGEVDLGDATLAAKIAPLTDVVGTGHHAALSAGVRPGSIAIVIGDGAVGLSATLAAKRLGAERLIVCGHHEGRLDIARRFGATDVVAERGAEAIARVREMTGGGAASVLECVGTTDSMRTAIGMTRPGGTVGYVGLPEGNEIDFFTLYANNIRIAGGVAPVRAYQDELLADVLAGRIDPSPLMDHTVMLDDIAAGYAAMDERRAVKVLVTVSTP